MHRTATIPDVTFTAAAGAVGGAALARTFFELTVALPAVTTAGALVPLTAVVVSLIALPHPPPPRAEGTLLATAATLTAAATLTFLPASVSATTAAVVCAATTAVAVALFAIPLTK